MIDYSIYLVTDAPGRYAHGLLRNVEAALEGGVTIVQYRPTAGSRREHYETALRLRDLLHRRKVPLIINDQVDLALAVDADGVHVGQDDLPADAVRRLIGPRKIVGLSITAAGQLDQVCEGVDYLGVGPIFATVTKPDAAPALGIEQIGAIIAQSEIPVVAIGGIDPANARALFAAGAVGVAVVSAFSQAANPAAIARALWAAKGTPR